MYLTLDPLKAPGKVRGSPFPLLLLALFLFPLPNAVCQPEVWLARPLVLGVYFPVLSRRSPEKQAASYSGKEERTCTSGRQGLTGWYLRVTVTRKYSFFPLPLPHCSLVPKKFVLRDLTILQVKCLPAALVDHFPSWLTVISLLLLALSLPPKVREGDFS